MKAVTSPEAIRRAATLHDAGHFEEAEALLRDAITYDPESADLRNARGVMFAAMGSIWTRSGAIGMR